MTGFHHVEVWVSDIPSAAEEWEWLITQLGFVVHSEWTSGQSWAARSAYLTVTTTPTLDGSSHNRRSPAVNHLAFHTGSTEHLDAIIARAENHGWSPLYPHRYPTQAAQQTSPVAREHCWIQSRTGRRDLTGGCNLPRTMRRYLAY